MQCRRTNTDTWMLSEHWEKSLIIYFNIIFKLLKGGFCNFKLRVCHILLPTKLYNPIAQGIQCSGGWIIVSGYSTPQEPGCSFATKLIVGDNLVSCLYSKGDTSVKVKSLYLCWWAWFGYFCACVWMCHPTRLSKKCISVGCLLPFR